MLVVFALFVELHNRTTCVSRRRAGPATAGDFHHQRPRREFGLLRKRAQHPAYFRRRRLDNFAAHFADQKNDRLLGGVAVAAGKIGVARREPVDEAVFEQEIERPVDGNRRRALAGRLGDSIDHLIGAKRTAFAGKKLENPPPPRGQADPVLAAKGERGIDRARPSLILRFAGPGIAVCLPKNCHGRILSQLRGERDLSAPWPFSFRLFAMPL